MSESDPFTKPQVKESTDAMLRKLIMHVLRTDSDLEAFCLDYFPGVKQQFTNEMGRNTKIDLLLRKCKGSDIFYNLQISDEQRFNAWENIDELKYMLS